MTDDDRCYQVCESDRRCGVLCLEPNMSFIANCHCESKNWKNVTCGCITQTTNVQNMTDEHEQDRCQQIVLPTTTPRWMQKRGFPAASILLLVIIGAAMIISLVKFVFHLLHGVSTSVNNNDRNITQVYNLPSTVPTSYFADILYIEDNQLQCVAKLHDLSQQLVIDTRQQEDGCDDFSVFLLKNKTAG
ncbi:unnamed protein product [Didymodactylos carnosus]|nr:unnamed protein product [Didymodactylos carnosus]CAF4166219.1 unnamed protein product [Didymodactylos carnosus]